MDGLYIKNSWGGFTLFNSRDLRGLKISKKIGDLFCVFQYSKLNLHIPFKSKVLIDRSRKDIRGTDGVFLVRHEGNRVLMDVRDIDLKREEMLIIGKAVFIIDIPL